MACFKVEMCLEALYGGMVCPLNKYMPLIAPLKLGWGQPNNVSSGPKFNQKNIAASANIQHTKVQRHQICGTFKFEV